MYLELNRHYNFSLHLNPVLPVTHKNARLVSIMDYHTALKFANVVLLHRQIYPHLPEGTLEDLTRYTYYHFKVKEESVVVADMWLVPTSIELSQGAIYTVKLMNVTNAQLNVVRDQLRMLGITFTVD